MTQQDLWPWPADTPTDRARRVARSYRDLALRLQDELRNLDSQYPDRVAVLDQQTIHLGQEWIVPQILTVQPDDLLTRWQAAEYCGVKAKTITEWRRRGLTITPTPDGDRYRVADLIVYQQAVRRRRLGPAD